jgi:16S rRNA C967 or C1407 C5-methylase (RsmB/RsmF family)
MAFPERFTKYLKENKIPEDIYEYNIPRYIRWNTLKEELNKEKVLKEYSDAIQLEAPYDKVFRLPNDLNVSNTSLYKSGIVYGMDISSIIAVHCLNLQPDDHFLDLCCAPGIKLSIAGDLITANGTGSITGVDISKERLSVAKSLLKRLYIGKARLFCESAVDFDEKCPVSVTLNDFRKRKKEGNVNRKKPFYASSVFSKGQAFEFDQLYDKVLCDVECTHDGSIKHIQKLRNNNQWDAFTGNLEEDKLEELYELQYKILHNGFRLLKRGGLLVYSTCSFSMNQNEKIIERFLDNNRDAECIRIDDDLLPVEHPAKRNEYGVRFDPVVSGTSGLFICKISKIKDVN